MATQTNQEPTTREEVMIAFETLLERHREQRNQINTRAETLAREEENDIVTRASTYSVEGLVKSVQQSLDKVKARLAEEVAQKEAAQLQYDKLVDKERKYFKLVKEFQLECERNEQAG